MKETPDAPPVKRIAFFIFPRMTFLDLSAATTRSAGSPA